MKEIGKLDQIKLAFLGCGKITAKHSKYARSVDKSIELSFSSRSLDKAKSYVDKYRGKHAFASYEEAIASKDINVVMINTPPHLHYELTEKALLAGKHVIVEKPPFFASSDFDKLAVICEKKGLRLMVAENYFYKPLRLKLFHLLKSEIIGKPLFIQINATKKQKTTNDWRSKKELTGYGSLFEGGIHWINFMNNLGFNFEKVQGFFPQNQDYLERSIQVVAAGKNGPSINLIYSWETSTIFKGLRISRIYGTEGSITFETNGVFIFLRSKRWSLIFPGFKDISGYRAMFKDFFFSLRSGIPPQFNRLLAKKDLEMIEEIYQSHN